MVDAECELKGDKDPMSQENLKKIDDMYNKYSI